MEDENAMEGARRSFFKDLEFEDEINETMQSELERLRRQVAEQQMEIERLKNSANETSTNNCIRAVSAPMPYAKNVRATESSSSASSFDVTASADDVLTPIASNTRFSPVRKNSEKMKSSRYSLNNVSRFAASESEIQKILSPKGSALDRFEKNAQMIKFDAENRRKTQIIAKSHHHFQPSGRNRKGKSHKRSSTLSDDIFRIDRNSLGNLVLQTDLLHLHKEHVLDQNSLSGESSFEQFFILSVDSEKISSLSSKEFSKSFGSNVRIDEDKHTLIFSMKDNACKALDHFSVDNAMSHKSMVNAMDLTPFCFPNGLEVYLSSSASKPADQSMILACTDEQGVTRRAVVVTIYEKLPAKIANSSIIPMLYDFKHICESSSRIARWWRTFLVERNSQGKFSRFITKMSTPSSRNLNPAPTSTETKRNFFKSPGLNRRNFKFGTPSFGTPSLKRENSASESTVTESKITLEEANKMFGNLDQVSASASMTPATSVGQDGCKKDLSVMDDQARNKLESMAKEAFAEMVEKDECFIPKCYVLFGGEESTLNLAALKRLIEAERGTRMNFGDDLKERQIKSLKPSMLRRTYSDDDLLREETQAKEIIKNEIIACRHKLLKFIASKLIIPKHLRGNMIDDKLSDLEFVNRPQKRFDFRLPVDYSQPISFPIPLPKLGEEWGLSVLLKNLSVADFTTIINLLLIERSIMVVGKDSLDVSASIFALTSLLKPYEWAGTVIPILPKMMIDFVGSPVPYIVGISGATSRNILEDYRVGEALQDGLSVVHLNDGYIFQTPEEGISDIVLYTCPTLRGKLTHLKSRLCELSRDHMFSGLSSFDHFMSNGMRASEAIVLRTVRSAVRDYTCQLAGDLHEKRGAFKKYGQMNKDTNEFEFYPEWFVAPRRSEWLLQEKLVHTQLFVSYVSKIRSDYEAEFSPREIAAKKKISRWLYREWMRKKDIKRMKCYRSRSVKF